MPEPGHEMSELELAGRWGPMVRVDELAGYVADLRGQLSDVALERRSGLSKGQLCKTLERGRDLVSLGVADRLLTRGLGRPDLVCLLELVEPAAGAGD